MPNWNAVLDIELGQVQKRVLDTAMGKFLFRVTPAGREFLLQEGTDQRYGARHLKRAIERYIVYPLANLLATRQVSVGDLVRIDWDGVHKELTFVRESQGALLLVEAAGRDSASAVAQAMKDWEGTLPPKRSRKETKAIPASAGGWAGGGADSGAEPEEEVASGKKTNNLFQVPGSAESRCAAFCHVQSDRNLFQRSQFEHG